MIPKGKLKDHFMSNPFKYGVVVSGNDFANREKELKELAGKLRENVRIFLVAPRRYGKTSLIENVLERVRKRGLLTAYVDLYWATSSREFLEYYVSSLLRGSKSSTRRVLSIVKDFLPRLRPRLSFDQEGKVELTFDISKQPPLQAEQEVFNLPEQIAKAQGKRFVVVLDEFQEILKLDGEELERQIRAAIQHHSNVSYLFAGSKSHMLIDMVSDRTRPFYQMGTLMTLDKIPEEEFRSFIESKFIQSGKNISPSALNRILKESDNVPHYVQLLSFNLWDHFQRVSYIEEAHVEEALHITLRGQEPAYLTLWEGLTHHQRKTAKAVTPQGGRLLTAKDTIRHFDLESASNVAKSLKSLISKGVLRIEEGAYVFEDVFFGRWVERIGVKF
jgi:AAA+ ATPase superfamily predicted ATPase